MGFSVRKDTGVDTDKKTSLGVDVHVRRVLRGFYVTVQCKSVRQKALCRLLGLKLLDQEHDQPTAHPRPASTAQCQVPGAIRRTPCEVGFFAALLCCLNQAVIPGLQDAADESCRFLPGSHRTRHPRVNRRVPR